MSQTKLFDSFQTDGSDNAVVLKVTIGFAQTGSTTVTLENKRFITAAADPNGNYRDSFTLSLGTHKQLAGKPLTVSSTVGRVQTASPTCSSQVELNGKAYDLLSGDLANIGDTIDLNAEIDLN